MTLIIKAKQRSLSPMIMAGIWIVFPAVLLRMATIAPDAGTLAFMHMGLILNKE